MKQLNSKNYNFIHQNLKNLNLKQQYYDPAQWPRAVIGFSIALIMLWVSITMNWIWTDSNNAKSYIDMQEYTRHMLQPPKEYLNESKYIGMRTEIKTALNSTYVIKRPHMALSF